jgi:hypothetical protein
MPRPAQIREVPGQRTMRCTHAGRAARRRRPTSDGRRRLNPGRRRPGRPRPRRRRSATTAAWLDDDVRPLCPFWGVAAAGNCPAAMEFAYDEASHQWELACAHPARVTQPTKAMTSPPKPPFQFGRDDQDVIPFRRNIDPSAPAFQRHGGQRPTTYIFVCGTNLDGGVSLP